MLSMDTAITTQGLSKKYAGTDQFALNDLDLVVKPGEVYGFLGPNGAGKSTTIKLLLNFIQPSSGSAKILGLDVVKDSMRLKSHVGYLSGELAIYEKMTGAQFLDYMAHLSGLKNKSLARELIKRFELDTSKKLRDLSKGNRQKIGVIQAFMHQPDVLILDEPTSGLDPLMQEEFFKLVREACERGAAVFVSSHNLAEVQKMCDRIGFIREGKLVAEQVVADVAAAAAQTFDITFDGPVPATELKSIPKAKVEKLSEHRVTLYMHGDLSTMFRVLARHKVVGINQRELNLETEFLKFYEAKK